MTVVPPSGGKLLWLLRHAKTVADPPPGGTDHERPLAPRGRRDADALARRLSPGSDRLGLPPDAMPGIALCSTATRTVETAERVLGALATPPAVTPLRSLYGASPEEVLAELALVDDAVRSVMVVGHNPTIHDLIAALPSAEDADGRRRIERGGVPTCALAVFALPVECWSAAAEGIATLLSFSTPPY
ncbi:MAG: SixA phosphatase family protein [Acidimicrobiales bacterium]